MFNRNAYFVSLIAMLVMPIASHAADDVDAATAAAMAAIVAGTANQAGPTVLQPPSIKPSVKVSPEAAEIATINQRIAVKAARLAELEMEAKIKAKETELAKGFGGDAGITQLDENVIPSVSEISGIDNKIWAVLNVNGGTQTVRVGDVAAGWKVTSIQSDAVTVVKKGKKAHLSFGNSVVQTQTQSQLPAGLNPQMGGMPGFPAR
ncbi:hypothetical protein [Diaphorobacter sp. LR2014-1]|uniref:hypothetical protein n=1 Tax=Diaphorobacter sp. LR2014-1 TaxID=1933219 RepID=UPI000CDA1F85|nr:hypothetical protein [Diaphorobacter sp. LR2014-1]POR10873.1 hypothetical protein BV908_09095 [Diaphorobacter sp. LR2014-1]